MPKAGGSFAARLLDSLAFENINTVLFSHPKKGAKQHATTK
jgi:hypothetical protein